MKCYESVYTWSGFCELKFVNAVGELIKGIWGLILHQRREQCIRHLVTALNCLICKSWIQISDKVRQFTEYKWLNMSEKLFNLTQEMKIKNNNNKKLLFTYQSKNIQADIARYW